MERFVIKEKDHELNLLNLLHVKIILIFHLQFPSVLSAA